jgi:hypothetical protein
MDGAGNVRTVACQDCGASVSYVTHKPKRCADCADRHNREYRNNYWRERRRTDRAHARKRADEALRHHREHREEKLAYFRANREYRNARKREYDASHQEQNRAYRQQEHVRRRYRQHKRVIEARRRARKRGAGGSWTVQDFERLCQSLNHCCYYCGKRCEKLTIEHRIPLSRGGSNHLSNVVPACSDCNTRKHALTDEEFLARLKASRVQGDPF